MAEDCGVGIDIAKATLDVALSTAPGQPWQTTNDEAGWAAVVAYVRAAAAAPSIVLEATGGYETGVATALIGRGLAGRDRQSPAGARFRPRARLAGERPIASTPAVLAAFAARIQPTPRPLAR